MTQQYSFNQVVTLEQFVSDNIGTLQPTDVVTEHCVKCNNYFNDVTQSVEVEFIKNVGVCPTCDHVEYE